MYPLTILALCLPPAAPAPKEAPKKEPVSLVGEWAAVGGGPGAAVPDGWLTFTFTPDGKFFVEEGGRGREEAGTYTADPKKDPAEVDILPLRGRTRPPLLGIYQVHGNTLTLCMVPGHVGARPARFEAPAGSAVSLLTFKRVQKKD
jgi:uncharacterized protein (TIGR03067 family)